MSWYRFWQAESHVCGDILINTREKTWKATEYAR